MAHQHTDQHAHATGAIDPVCGTAVDPEHAAGSSRIDGTLTVRP
jgi:hypothetical protein